LLRLSSYTGPACPHCKTPVPLTELSDGAVLCPRCGGEYEARIFHPPTRSARVLQLVQSGPEAAGACANHPRNAAVTNCERCGIFICSLCELEVDGTKYCPACFERLAQEGAIHSARTRFRAYGSLAGLSAVAGLFLSGAFLGLPLGVLALYYVGKGFRTRRDSGASVFGLVLAAIFALAAIATSVGMVFLYSHSFAKK
jgi:uncharacterized Zn finger protein (UPF0148 family)